MVLSSKGEAEEFALLTVKYSKPGTVIYAPGGCFGPRIQQDLQLVLLHTGSMRVKIDGVLLQVPTGHITLLKPGHEEVFVFAKAQETWHRWIAVSVEEVPLSMLHVLNELPAYIPISDRMNRIVELMLLLVSSGLSCEEVLNDLGRAALMLYVSEAKHYNTIEIIHPAVLAVKEYIQQNYVRDCSLPLLAKIANLTLEHLIRVFQRDAGMTPIKYMWHYRLNQGLELLRSTGLSIGEIAESIGFKTSYHFARMVKQDTGKTASEIRRESWQGHK
jgi:AraC family transcriptional regulator, arabinose operon regulatory protein